MLAKFTALNLHFFVENHTGRLIQSQSLYLGSLLSLKVGCMVEQLVSLTMTHCASTSRIEIENGGRIG